MAITRRWLISVFLILFTCCCIERFRLHLQIQSQWQRDAQINPAPITIIPSVIAVITNNNNDTHTHILHTDSTTTSTFESSPSDVWRQTTQFLYKDSPQLKQWIDRPPLKLFIYDTLPEEFSIEAVSTCINNKYNADRSNNCNWDPVVCNENSSGTYPYYNLYRTNFNNDVVLLKRFLRYEYQTKDPNEADLFIVPYPHKSHCLCRQKDPNHIMCSYSYKYIESEIINRMEYFKQHPSRHLFILGSDWALANPPLRKKSLLQLSLGSADGCRKRRRGRGGGGVVVDSSSMSSSSSYNCGSLVIPYVNTDANYQPKSLVTLPESWWLDRPRQYSLTAIMGTPTHLPVRRELYNNATTLLGDDIGGLPIYLSTSGKDRNLKRHDVAMDMYRNSIFCPILPGDDCGQKRFFDVVLSGCIPVVLRYSTSDEPEWPSWFREGACSIRRAYPFGRGAFFNDPHAGMDYTTLVVEINVSSSSSSSSSGGGCCGLSCIKPTLEHLIMMEPDKIRTLRRNLMSAARLFTYGLEEDSYRYPDAFSALLVTLRHYSTYIP